MTDLSTLTQAAKGAYLAQRDFLIENKKYRLQEKIKKLEEEMARSTSKLDAIGEIEFEEDREGHLSFSSLHQFRFDKLRKESELVLKSKILWMKLTKHLKFIEGLSDEKILAAK